MGDKEHVNAPVRDLRQGPSVGNNVSHANNKTKRRWSPNLQRVRANMKGTVKYIARLHAVPCGPGKVRRRRRTCAGPVNAQ